MTEKKKSTDSFHIYLLSLLLLLLSVQYVHAQDEIEITDYFAKIYIAPSEKSKYIGLAQRGERYKVISFHYPWVRIQFKNAIGWVYESQTGSIGGAPLSNDTGSTDSDSIEISKDVSTADSGSNTKQLLKPDPQSTDSSVAVKKEPIARPYYTSSGNSRTETGNKNKPKEEEEEKPRNWFSKKTLPELPSISQSIEGDTLTLYFKVTYGPARVLSDPSIEDSILVMAKRGDIFTLIEEGDPWCKVQFNDSTAWIERKYGEVIDNLNNYSLSDFLPVIYLTSAIIIFAALIVLIYVSFRRKKQKQVSSNIKKNVLMIAKNKKIIQYTLTSTSTSLEQCFSEIGFTVTISKDNQSIRNLLTQNSPDVILVDWKFDKSILTSLERLFATLPGSEKVLIIAYNVPDPLNMPPSQILTNISYLGSIFSDRDIFKIVTPLIINENNRNVQKSFQSSALEGVVGEGNLIEVLQFIEIGRKSGCLLVETDRPFGLIYFNDGRIIYSATSAGILGKDAIFEVLDLKSGVFRFVINKQPKISNVNFSTLEILMEWTKAIDEAPGN